MYEIIDMWGLRVEVSFQTGREGDVGIEREFDINLYFPITGETLEELLSNFANKIRSYEASDKSNWYSDTDGKATFSQLETDRGKAVTENDPEFEQWQEGEIKLFRAFYMGDFIKTEKVPSEEFK